MVDSFDNMRRFSSFLGILAEAEPEAEARDGPEESEAVEATVVFPCLLMLVGTNLERLGVQGAPLNTFFSRGVVPETSSRGHS